MKKPQLYQILKQEPIAVIRTDGLYQLLTTEPIIKPGSGKQGIRLRKYNVEVHSPPKLKSLSEQKPLKLEGTGKSFKIFGPEGGAPRVRLDLEPHEYGDKHLQFREKVYTDRKGDKAAEIFAEIIRLNLNIQFPEPSKKEEE